MATWCRTPVIFAILSCSLFDEGFVLELPERKHPEEIGEFQAQQKLFEVQKETLHWSKLLGITTVGDMNDYFVKKDIGELILIQEAYQEGKIAEIAARIAANPGKKIVMIAGPSSSGKTTFSHRLSIQLAAHGLKPHPIPVDDYFSRTGRILRGMKTAIITLSAWKPSIRSFSTMI